jgi:multicomponent Na+:H+ antiporter subunit C
MDAILDMLISRTNYWVYIILMMIGLYGIITKNNLVKKIIGMNILQTAVILFFISVGAKQNATLPIIEHGHDSIHSTASIAHYINPLPHVLMLTAIVVAVATLGVALALVIRIHQRYHTLEENEILERIREA